MQDYKEKQMERRVTGAGITNQPSRETFHKEILTERNHARKERYNGKCIPKRCGENCKEHAPEEFGLAKRTMRNHRGLNCSLPDGSYPNKKRRAARV